MPRLRIQRLFVFAAVTGLLVAQEEPVPARYRVEQIVRLETTRSRPPGEARAFQSGVVTVSVEGRVRLVLEQRLRDGAAGRGRWRFTQVAVEGPTTEPAAAADAGVERALALGLEWIERLEGQEFSGGLDELPVLPLGEAAPAWLTEWLRWAQTGIFADAKHDPLLAGREEGAPAASMPFAYETKWLRTDARQVPCHVQRARWTAPVAEAPRSVPAQLAAQGVRARTHFAAQSLEWVAQRNPRLIYAERSGVRETFWDLQNVSDPALRALVFRLRLSVQVRVERLP